MTSSHRLSATVQFESMTTPIIHQQPIASLKNENCDTDIQNSRGVRTLIADDSPWMLKPFPKFSRWKASLHSWLSATDGSQAVRYASTIEPELILMDFTCLT